METDAERSMFKGEYLSHKKEKYIDVIDFRDKSLPSKWGGRRKKEQVGPSPEGLSEELGRGARTEERKKESASRYICFELGGKIGKREGQV